MITENNTDEMTIEYRTTDTQLHFFYSLALSNHPDSLCFLGPLVAEYPDGIQAASGGCYCFSATRWRESR